ncbi:MAG: DUF1292 domain-containing protein [Clostridiales bacterium]|nr:DUF1292 domain-containing protein [Clostridiales bacterium]
MANDEILEGTELEENIIVLTDDEGNEVEFEFVDLIEMDEKEYVILIPVDQDEEEAGEVVILKVEANEEDEEGETYVSVDNEEEANKVFEMFKEKFKDEFEFVD